MVGGDPLAGCQVDRGEAQRQTLVAVDGAGLAEGTVTELEAFAADVQRALATAGAAGDDPGGRRLRTVPDQVGGADRGDTVAVAVAIDRRGAQHQARQAGATGARIVGVEADVAVEVERVAGVQHQRLQSRRTRRGIALQQAVEHLLVERQPRRQHTTLGQLGQQCLLADIEAAHRQGQVAGAVAHTVVEHEALVGGRDQTAFGIQPGFASHAIGSGNAEQDIAGTTIRRSGFRRQDVQHAVRQGEHGTPSRRIQEAIPCIVGCSPPPQGNDGGPLLEADRLSRPVRQEEHLGCGQLGAIAQDDALRAIGDVEGDVVAALPVENRWRRADHHARRTEGVEIFGPQRHALETLAGLRAGTDDLDPLVVAQYHQATAIAATGGLEQPIAIEHQCIGATTGA